MLGSSRSPRHALEGREENFSAQGKGTQPPAVTVSHFESQREKEFPCACIAFVCTCFFVRFQHARGTLSGCAERAVGSSCAFRVRGILNSFAQFSLRRRTLPTFANFNASRTACSLGKGRKLQRTGKRHTAEHSFAQSLHSPGRFPERKKRNFLAHA